MSVEQETPTRYYTDALLEEIRSELTEQNNYAAEQTEVLKDVLELMKGNKVLLEKIDREFTYGLHNALDEQTRELRTACDHLRSIDMSAQADHLCGVQQQLRQLEFSVSANFRMLFIITVLLALLLWRLW